MRTVRYYIEEHSLMRMIGWLPAGLFFYYLSIYVFVNTEQAQIQLLTWKLGNLCSFAWLGYWIARQISGRLQELQQVNTTWEAIIYAARILARAILVYGSMQVSGGL